MSLFVLDTDTISLFQDGHEAVSRRVMSRPLADLAISVITVEEQLSAWCTLLRRAKNATALAKTYRRLADAVTVLGRFPILSFTEQAISQFELLKARRLGIKHMDLRIAAIAMVHNATLVSRNARDFEQVAGLSTDDWTK